MICATFLFAAMGVCVKYASDLYGAGEIVMYRGLVGVIGIALVARARGISLRTKVPEAIFTHTPMTAKMKLATSIQSACIC